MPKRCWRFILLYVNLASAFSKKKVELTKHNISQLKIEGYIGMRVVRHQVIISFPTTPTRDEIFSTSTFLKKKFCYVMLVSLGHLFSNFASFLLFFLIKVVLMPQTEKNRASDIIRCPIYGNLIPTKNLNYITVYP